MAKLSEEHIVTIRVLNERGTSNCSIARTLGVTEGTGRYHLRRQATGAEDEFYDESDSLVHLLKVSQLVEFYVKEHNERLPHSAFRGQTPDEMYFGRGDDVPGELDAGKKAARQRRVDLNRALSCLVCEPAYEADAA